MGTEGEVWAESMLDIFLGSDLRGGLCVGRHSWLSHSNKHSPNLSGSKQKVYCSHKSIAQRSCSKLHGPRNAAHQGLHYLECHQSPRQGKRNWQVVQWLLAST